MYFGFNIGGLSDPLGVYEKIEEEARLTMMRCGGSLSHHHGIGKLRKKLLPLVMSPCGLEILKKLKEDIDPQNIFATDNIVTVTPHKPESDEKKTAAL